MRTRGTACDRICTVEVKKQSGTGSKFRKFYCMAADHSWIFFNSSTTSVLFINLGILAFSLAVLFQIVTLLVEFDASHRALKILGNTGMLYEDEVRDTRKVLTAAALTYVAGAASAILQLLRILLLTGNRRND